MAVERLADRDEDRLVRYLLGELPSSDAEALDQQSVGDDALARRLQSIEQDLIDDYVRGALDPSLRDRFIEHYLATEHRRQRLRFAEALFARQHTAHPAPARADASRGVWPVATAAALVLVTATLLLIRENSPPREQADPVVSNPPAAAPPSPAPQAPPKAAEAPLPLAFTLSPPLRSAGAPPPRVVPESASEILLRLELEEDRFRRYGAAVRDAHIDRVVWRIGGVESAAVEGRRVVPVLVPAKVLSVGTYVLELEGLAPSGQAEPIAAYPFRIIRSR